MAQDAVIMTRSLLHNKAAFLTRGRAPDQHPGNDHDCEKGKYAGFTGEIGGERWILRHRCARQHTEDGIEGAVCNHHWPEAPGRVTQVSVEDSGGSEHCEEERHDDEPVAYRVVGGREQYQRQVPHPLQEANEGGASRGYSVASFGSM